MEYNMLKKRLIFLLSLFIASFSLFATAQQEEMLETYIATEQYFIGDSDYLNIEMNDSGNSSISCIDDIYPIGTIIPSSLSPQVFSQIVGEDLANFHGTYYNTWALADGLNVNGSTYTILTNNEYLPNLMAINVEDETVCFFESIMRQSILELYPIIPEDVYFYIRIN
jgi:hypothetical protein